MKDSETQQQQQKKTFETNTYRINSIFSFFFFLNALVQNFHQTFQFISVYSNQRTTQQNIFKLYEHDNICNRITTLTNDSNARTHEHLFPYFFSNLSECISRRSFFPCRKTAPKISTSWCASAGTGTTWTGRASGRSTCFSRGKISVTSTGTRTTPDTES